MVTYRKIEFIMLPEGNGNVKRFWVPGVVLSLLIAFFLLSASIMSWVVVDYAIMKSKARQITQLEKDNQDQRMELLEMSGRVIRIVDELDGLQAIDSDDEVILGLEAAHDDIQVELTGLSSPTTFLSDHILWNRYIRLVRQMHSALAYVKSEIDVRASQGTQIAHFVDSMRSMNRSLHYVRARQASPKNRAFIRKKLRSIAIELGLAPRLALSMAKVESGYDHKAVSPKGAIGVLQLMPQFVCPEYEVPPEMLFDPEVNIRIGLNYMKSLLDRFDENVDLSLAAYNAGPRRVIEAGYGIPRIGETQEYVRKVKEAMEVGVEDLLQKQTFRKQNLSLRNAS